MSTLWRRSLSLSTLWLSCELITKLPWFIQSEFFPLSLLSIEQDQRPEDVHGAEQLQDAEEEKDDSNEEENKDSLVDDEEEKEDLVDEDEVEEYEEEDNLAGIMDKERSDANDQEVLQEGSVSQKEREPDEAHSVDTQEVLEDSLRQRKSQQANKGP